MSTVQTPAAEVRLRVEELTGFHAGFAGALGETGIGGPKLHDFLAAHVRATCVGCALELAGGDLDRLMLSAATVSDPKLDRLRLGYCGRPGCESRFYQVTVTAPPGADVAALLTRGLELWRNPPPEPKADPGPQPWWKIRRNQYALGFLAVALLVWWKFGPTEGPLAVRKEPVKYQAAPQPLTGGNSGEALQ
jgi:hypothetical protein